MEKTTNVHFVLDKSGSMCCVKSATISGFNEYVGNLKKDKKSNYNFSLTLFNTEVEQRYVAKPIKSIKDLDDKTYEPAGMTALYDAVCRTIDSVEKSKSKNIVIIMTDGEENSSKEYTDKDLKKKIKDLQAKKNWTFVFLGANQDSWIMGQKMGLHKGNVANYNNTFKGVEYTMDLMAENTRFTSRSTLSSNDCFFSQADKDNLKKNK